MSTGTIYLDDSFETYGIGGPPGGGWFDSGAIFSNGIINADPPHTPGNTSIASSTKCCKLGDLSNVYDALGIAMGLVTFSFRIGNTNVDSVNRTAICSLLAAPPPGTDYPTYTLLELVLEQDLTLSLYNPYQGILFDANDPLDGHVANSGLDIYDGIAPFCSLYTGRWYMFQLSFGISVGLNLLDPSSGETGIYAAGSCAVNGQLVLSGKGAFTGASTTAGAFPVHSGQAKANGVQFQDPIGGGLQNSWIDNVTVSDPTAGWPHPAIPPDPHCKISQIAVEYAYQPLLPAHVRISQLVTEYASMPNPSARARMSQLVVEIPGFKAPTGGWLVKES